MYAPALVAVQICVYNKCASARLSERVLVLPRCEIHLYLYRGSVLPKRMEMVLYRFDMSGQRTKDIA